jgi:hypothetical protein
MKRFKRLTLEQLKAQAAKQAAEREERFPGEDSLEDVVTRHNRMIDETHERAQQRLEDLKRKEN